MRIEILCVGEVKKPYLKEAEKDYLSRLRHYCKIESGFIDGEKIVSNKQEKNILAKEAGKLLNRIGEGSLVAALDRKGHSCSSEELSDRICEWQNRGLKKIVFVIGGPLGLDEKIIRRANLVLSLSEMTFAHEMVKLILLEQLYRAFTIIKGEKYHKYNQLQVS